MAQKVAISLKLINILRNDFQKNIILQLTLSRLLGG